MKRWKNATPARPHIVDRTDGGDARLGVHHGVTCDGCGADPIRGLRFKCTTCHNYDLCRACYRHRTAIHEPGHSFRWVSHGPGRHSSGSPSSAASSSVAGETKTAAVEDSSSSSPSAPPPHWTEPPPRRTSGSSHHYYCHQCQDGFELPGPPDASPDQAPQCPTCAGFFVERWQGLEAPGASSAGGSSLRARGPGGTGGLIMPRRRGVMRLRGAARRRGSARRLVEPELPSVHEVQRVLEELQMLQAALSQRGDLLQAALAHQSLTEDANKPVPATPDAIAALPTVTLQEHQVKDSAHCTICLDGWACEQKGEKGRDDTTGKKEASSNPVTSKGKSTCCGGGGPAVVLPCKHFFHKDCIVDWLQRSGTCPICRARVGPDEAESKRQLPAAAGGGAVRAAAVSNDEWSSDGGHSSAEDTSGDGDDDDDAEEAARDRALVNAALRGYPLSRPLATTPAAAGRDSGDAFLRHLMPQTAASLWHRDAEEAFGRPPSTIPDRGGSSSADEADEEAFALLEAAEAVREDARQMFTVEDARTMARMEMLRGIGVGSEGGRLPGIGEVGDRLRV